MAGREQAAVLATEAGPLRIAEGSPSTDIVSHRHPNPFIGVSDLQRDLSAPSLESGLSVGPSARSLVEDEEGRVTAPDRLTTPRNHPPRCPCRTRRPAALCETPTAAARCAHRMPERLRAQPRPKAALVWRQQGDVSPFLWQNGSDPVKWCVWNEIAFLSDDPRLRRPMIASVLGRLSLAQKRISSPGPMEI